MNFGAIGKIILTISLILFIIGSLFYFMGKAGFKGFPGDFLYKKDGFRFYFPVATCLVISIILTIVFNLFLYLLRR